MGRGMFADDLRAYEEALEHHGILGQKWGTRHGPPYPLKDAVSRAISRVKGDGKAKAKGAEQRKDGLSKSLKNGLKAGLIGAVVGPYAANAYTSRSIVKDEVEREEQAKRENAENRMKAEHPEISAIKNDGEKNWCRFNVWELDGTNCDMVTKKSAQAASILIDRGYAVEQKDRRDYGSIKSPKDITDFFKNAKIESIPLKPFSSLDSIDSFLEKHRNEKGFVLYELDDRSYKSSASTKPAKYAAIEIGKNLTFGGEDGHAVGREVPQYGGGMVVSDIILDANGMGRVMKGMGGTSNGAAYYIRTDNLELNPSIFDHVTPV